MHSSNSRPSRARILLATSSALGALAMAQGAQAADECGPIVNGAVTCTAAGNPHAAGIRYTPGGALALTLAPGTVVNQTTTATGNMSTIAVRGTGGAITIAAPGVNVSTSVAPAGVIVVDGGGAAVSLNIGNITSTATGGTASGRAIQITNSGATTIVAGNIATAGTVDALDQFANSVVRVDRTPFFTNSGPVSITTGSITATGADMNGIGVGIRQPRSGDITITVNGAINVTGTGITTNASSGGQTVVVANGAITGAAGIDLYGFATRGVDVTANGRVTATDGVGIRANAIGGGDVFVAAQSVSGTRGGIFARAQSFFAPGEVGGDVFVTVAPGSIVNGGEGEAVSAGSSRGSVSIIGRDATFIGSSQIFGMLTATSFGPGDAFIDVGVVEAIALSGDPDFSTLTGMQASAQDGGNAFIRVREFRGTGVDAMQYGIAAVTVSGLANVDVVNRASANASSATVAAFTLDGLANVDASGAVLINTGRGGAALALANAGSASITSDTATGGEDLPGLLAMAFGGTASVTAGTTTSRGSNAIYATGDDVVIVTTGLTTTQSGVPSAVGSNAAIFAQAVNSVSITAAAVNSAGSGIAAEGNGAITITTRGPVTAASGTGVSAFGGGGGPMTVSIGGAVQAGGADVPAVSLFQAGGTSPVTLTTTAAIASTGPGSASSAISITNLGSGATRATIGGDARAVARGAATVLLQSAGAAQTLTTAAGTTVRAAGAESTGILVQTGGNGPIAVTIDGAVINDSRIGAGRAILLQSGAAAPIRLTGGAASAITANAIGGTAAEILTLGSVVVDHRGIITSTGAESLALGVFAGGPVSLTTNVIESGAFGILAQSGSGPLSLTTLGATNGAGRAIQLVSGGLSGDLTAVINGSVTSRSIGTFSNVGIFASQGNAAGTGNVAVTTNGALTVTEASRFGASGIEANTMGRGAVSVAANAAVTVSAPGGGAASGIAATATSGAVSVTQNGGSTVTVTGGGQGTAAVTGILAATTSGAISINSAGTLTSTNNGTRQSAGIIAQTATGSVAVNQTGSIVVNGANIFGIGVLRSGMGNSSITANNVTATGATGVAIGVSGGTADITIGAGGTVNGGGAGVLLLGTTAANVTNRGVLRALSGVAIDASAAAGPLTFTNAAGAEIIGAVFGGGGADSIVNAGTFTMQGLSSSAGAGANSFANSGLLRFGSAAAPQALGFAGLTSFANASSGVIDLRGRGAGDVLSLAGAAYTGAAGSQLIIDAVLAGPGSVADQLIVGRATGVTALIVNDISGSAGAYNPLGMRVVSATSSDAGAFVLAQPIRKGLWDYSLQRNAAGTEFRLASAPGVAVFEIGLVPALLRDQWHQSVGPVRDRLAAVQAGDSARRGLGLWLTSNAGTGSRGAAALVPQTVGTGSQTFDLDSDQNHVAVTGGIDYRTDAGSGELVVGIGGGWVNAQAEFGATGDRIRSNGHSISGYLGWSGKRGYVALVGHATFAKTDLRFTGAGAPRAGSPESQSIGATAVAGYRLPLGGRFYVEPEISIAYARTSIDAIVADATGIAFADRNSWRTRPVLRVGRDWSSANGGTRYNVFASAGGTVERGQGPIVAFASGPGYVTRDDGDFASAVFAGGIDVTDVRRGAGVFVRAEYSGLNEDQWQGLAVRGGVRVAF